MERERMTVKEVAAYLGVHADMIYTMARKNEIPHFKMRSKILFTRDVIEKWVQDQELQ
nr:helix-turn-helix domain-containing protein [Lentibacillus sp. JNUCC-1]